MPRSFARCIFVVLAAGALLPADAFAEWPSVTVTMFPWWAKSDDKPGAPNGNGENGNGDKKEDDEPKHIRDNGFFVEEASNQEPGVVQHIFNCVNFWNSMPQERTRDFLYAYTMEIPLGSQKHQFSFTTQFLTAYEKPAGGQASLQGDVADTFLNYRYQLLADDDFLWCAPRFSLLVPTGDKRFGSGFGQLGYQVNLPISRYGENFDFHLNIGGTCIPHVSLPQANGVPSPRHDLRGFNIGAAAYWKPRVNLHFFVEAVAFRFENIDDFGFRQGATQVLVNPGVRYAICQLDDVEWVVGLSVPVGLNHDTPDIGVFAYMSVEHSFRKKKKD